jgi:hypothetical protein
VTIYRVCFSKPISRNGAANFMLLNALIWADCRLAASRLGIEDSCRSRTDFKAAAADPEAVIPSRRVECLVPPKAVTLLSASWDGPAYNHLRVGSRMAAFPQPINLPRWQSGGHRYCVASLMFQQNARRQALNKRKLFWILDRHSPRLPVLEIIRFVATQDTC